MVAAGEVAFLRLRLQDSASWCPFPLPGATVFNMISILYNVFHLLEHEVTLMCCPGEEHSACDGVSRPSLTSETEP